MPTTIKPKIYTYIIRSFGTIQKVDTSSPSYNYSSHAEDDSKPPDKKELFFWSIILPNNIEILTNTELSNLQDSPLYSDKQFRPLTYVPLDCFNMDNKFRKTSVYTYRKEFPQLLLTGTRKVPKYAPEDEDEYDETDNCAIIHCIPELKKTTIIKKFERALDEDGYYEMSLSSAIIDIREHCKATYPTDYSKCIIQIHIEAVIRLTPKDCPQLQIVGAKSVPNLSYFSKYLVDQYNGPITEPEPFPVYVRELDSTTSSVEVFRTPETLKYTYLITCHGSIAIEDKEDKNIVAIYVPKNVEIVIFQSLGEITYSTTSCLKGYVCKEYDYILRGPNDQQKPLYKYKDCFPQLNLLGAEFRGQSNYEKTYKDMKENKWIHDITHCISEDLANPNKKKVEVIHSFSVQKYKHDGNSCPPLLGKYDASEHYKKILADSSSDMRLPSKFSNYYEIRKCGWLYLSEAIAIIQEHCEATYPTNYSKCIIEIQVQACLEASKYPRERGLSRDEHSKYKNLIEFEQHNCSNNDLQIWDTKEIKTYIFTFYKSELRISVKKIGKYDTKHRSKSDLRNIDEIQSCLKWAILSCPSATLRLTYFPKIVTITILDAYKKTNREIQDIIYSHILEVDKDEPRLMWADITDRLSGKSSGGTNLKKLTMQKKSTNTSIISNTSKTKRLKTRIMHTKKHRKS